MRSNVIIILLLSLLVFSNSCVDESETVSYNLSEEVHKFKVFRRVVFYNGITDSYILQVEGYCSVVTENDRLAVIIKTDNGGYLKHYLGLSDNVTYFAEQLEPNQVSSKHYKVIFRPSVIIPDIEVK